MDNAIQLPWEMSFQLRGKVNTSNMIVRTEEEEEQVEEEEELVTLIGSVTDRMGSQSDTGYIPWPAATILARWLAQNR